MRTLALIGWLLVPVAVGAYHYGPGQDQLRLDGVADELTRARAQADRESWSGAAASYEKALALLPNEHKAEARRIRLERAKAWVNDRKLPEAAADLKALLSEVEEDQAADPALVADVRDATANAQYYLTWLMRLEGLPREEWEPEIDAARQAYKLLAETADDEADAGRHAEDLESAIRLARMEPDDLQGLAIPKQCQNCKSGQCKNPGKKPGKKPSNSPPKDARGASAGPPPDNKGS